MTNKQISICLIPIMFASQIIIHLIHRNPSIAIPIGMFKFIIQIADQLRLGCIEPLGKLPISQVILWIVGKVINQRFTILIYIVPKFPISKTRVTGRVWIGFRVGQTTTLTVASKDVTQATPTVGNSQGTIGTDWLGSTGPSGTTLASGSGQVVPGKHCQKEQH